MVSLVALLPLALVLCSSTKAQVAAPCKNLGSWLAKEELSTYKTINSFMFEGDKDKTCLKPGGWIGQCLRLVNPSQTGMLLLQPDGNAVIYAIWYALTCNNGNGCISPIWSTGTVNSGAVAVKLSNGKFFVDTSLASSGGIQRWDAGKTGSATGTRLCIQNDFNLVLYDTKNAVVWSSGSNR
ncbi:hypothetical protein BDR26DRAFT_858740 [Obelidium mucronatum]|nr:hypothetical protein BDR26DRAFT_858740 [Obelidium mucronatum]